MRARMLVAVLGVLLVGLAGCRRTGVEPGQGESIAVEGEWETMEELGGHMLMVGACNDCHTPAFMAQGLTVPQSLWYTGTSMGFRGPWGTSYPTNLRLSARSMSEDTWVETFHVRQGLPPMPWFGLHAMTDTELRAIHRHLVSLEPVGSPVPDPLPPDVEPTTPYINMLPVMPEVSTIELLPTVE